MRDPRTSYFCMGHFHFYLIALPRCSCNIVFLLCPCHRPVLLSVTGAAFSSLADKVSGRCHGMCTCVLAAVGKQVSKDWRCRMKDKGVFANELAFDHCIWIHFSPRFALLQKAEQPGLAAFAILWGCNQFGSDGKYHLLFSMALIIIILNSSLHNLESSI